MENKAKGVKAHCIVLAYPVHGHVNPMLEFSRRLQQREGIRVTFVSTHFFCRNSLKLPAASDIAVESISDGLDCLWIHEGDQSVKLYLDRFREVGTQALTELIEKLNRSENPVDCIVYDSFLPWPLDVAKRLGLVSAIFLTQNLAVDNIYYHVNQKKLQLPVSEEAVSLPGLPPLSPSDMPSFLSTYESQPSLFNLVVGQFSDIEEADWILCNTFYELEKEVADCMTKIWPKLMTIGPTIPYVFLETNNGLEDDADYGFKSEECSKWLDDQPKGSVVLVAFGTLSALSGEQMDELASGLRDSGMNFLWVVRDSEEAKLPNDFAKKTEKNFVVSWCHQQKVLSHQAIGCFVTHCGWNSTFEALSLGVPMVGMPQWTDQPTNAKLIMDVWKMGLRPSVNEKGVVRREALKNCLWKIMKDEEGREIRDNAKKWRNLATMAVGKGGSSHKNIEGFLEHLFQLKGSLQDIESEIKENGIEKNGVQKNEIEKNGVEKNKSIEKIESIEKNGIDKKGVEKNKSIEKNESIEKNGIDKKGVENNESIKKNGIEKNEIQKNGILKNGIEKNEIQNNGIEKNEIE